MKKFILVTIFFVFLLSIMFTVRVFVNKSKPTVPTQTIEIKLPQPKAEASIDDDPIMGKADAPVTIIEFSSFECPFCKKFFNETLPQLKEEYIATGNVRFVYRDFTLPTQEPAATKEAVAASCARKQGGDFTYFAYHDFIFRLTESGGKGIWEEKYQKIASDIGLNIELFQYCLSDQPLVEEVKIDTTDGMNAGVYGTPTFIIGKTSMGKNVSGVFLNGAQPFNAFKAIIDPMLE